MDFPNQPSINPNPVPPAVPPVNPPVTPSLTPPTMTGAPAGVAPAVVPPAPAPLPYSATPPAPAQIPVQAQPLPGTGATATDDQVYTMPEKFLHAPGATAPAKQKRGKALTWILIIIIVLAVFGIVAGIAFFVLRTLPQMNQTATTNVTNTTTNTNVNRNRNQADATNENDNTNNSNVTINQNDNTNDNANDNINETTVNDNTNGNDNTNVNVNDNVNANANANTNITVTEVVPSKDTDQDSLTNEEEKLYATKADLPDTDNDGYNDGVELVAGYDPTNPVSSGRLSDNSAIVNSYANKEFGYKIVYPNTWVAEALSEGASNEVLFTPNTLDTAGQFLEVIVEDNPTGFSAVDWYLDQVSDVSEDDLTSIITFDGVEGVLSLDGYTAYFTTNTNVYAVSYRFGSSKEVHFQSTFTFMAKSFVLTKKSKDNAN